MKTTTIAHFAQFAALAVTSIALLSGCGSGEASTSDAETTQVEAPVPVEIALPVRADIYATYAVSASIASDADAPVTARIAGEVIELLAEEGDQVKAGQILARLDGQRLRLEMLAAAANLKRARKEYSRNIDLHQRGLISTSMFEGLKYDLAALEATYELKQLNYGYANIRATITGVVSSRDIKPGETLAPGQVAFRITDTSELIAYLQIPQAELAKFSAGHAASVAVVAVPNKRFSATIVRISPTIDVRNGTFRATAIIGNSHGALAPGMFGRFSIAYEKHSNALVIPAAAVLDEDDKKIVYVVSNGEVLRRVITTGIEQDGRYEILDGLENNEKVVVVGHSSLRDGSKVLANVSNKNSVSG